MNRLPLGLIKAGSTAIIRDIRGSDHLRQELLEQGLVDGCRVKVVKNDPGGPLIISVNNDTRLAVGRGASLQVLVEEAVEPGYREPELVPTNISIKAPVEM